MSVCTSEVDRPVGVSPAEYRRALRRHVPGWPRLARVILPGPAQASGQTVTTRLSTMAEKADPGGINPHFTIQR